MTAKKSLMFLLAMFALWSVSVMALAQTSTSEPVSTSEPTPTPIPVPLPTPEPQPIPLPTPTSIPVPIPTAQQCPQNCNCDSQGKVLWCEVIPTPTPQPIPVPQPTPEPTPVPQPTPQPQPIPQPTPTPMPASLPANIQWSTSAPIKVEVTATETSISTPQPTNSKLPANCIKKGGTITCPTSEAKQIVVPVIAGATNSPMEVVTIQKQTDNYVGITSQGVTAVTTEKVTVENNHLFIGSSEDVQSVSVLPSDANSSAVTSAGLTAVATAELKIEDQQPIYIVQGTREGKLFFFIPVSVETIVKIDATNGDVISTRKPWWNFLAW